MKTAGRDFYSSGKADDYLSYIDKGIKTAGVRDYVDYAGDDEKSSGIFSAQGLLNKEEKKELRAELRETKSCIWDCVISFEEVYGKANCNNWIRAPREHRQPAHPSELLPARADRLRPQDERTGLPPGQDPAREDQRVQGFD